MTVQHAAESLVLFVATFPFLYYLLATYSSIRLFANRPKPNPDLTPPVSILKPIRGLDEDAFENFASFCRQDYPEYELLFCLGRSGDPNVPVIEKLAREFPARSIRILIESSQKATNGKVSRLSRLASEAKYPWLVFSDSDIRVAHEYLRTVMGPFRDERVGAVTCLYLQTGERSIANKLQTIGQVSDFYASLSVARMLDGRMVSEKGYQVELLPYAVRAVADFESFRGFLAKRRRWAVVQKNMRPWGHFGLLLTLGLPWSLAAIAVHPTASIAAAYLGSYVFLRFLMTSIITDWGLKQPSMLKKFWLIPVWDALAAAILLASFTRNRVRWRDGVYTIRKGALVPVVAAAAQDFKLPAEKKG